MGGEDSTSKQSRKKMGMRRKAKKESAGFDGDNSRKNVSGKAASASAAANFKHENLRRETDSGTSFVRWAALFKLRVSLYLFHFHTIG